MVNNYAFNHFLGGIVDLGSIVRSAVSGATIFDAAALLELFPEI